MKGVASYTDPKSCAAVREDRREALTGECAGQVLSGVSQVRGADVLRTSRRPHGTRRIRETCANPASSKTLACTHVSCTGTGRSPSSSLSAVAGASSGRPGAVADDECDGEVGLVQSSEEASEQSSISCCGACGTKGRGQGECGPANHGPDAEPGSRVTSVGSHTGSRHQEQKREADGASASHRHKYVARKLPRFEEVCGTGC